MNNKFSHVTCFLFVITMLGCYAQELYAAGNGVKEVTALSKVFGDGRKPTTIIVEYDTIILDSSLSDRSYTVEDATVSRIYAAQQPDVALSGANGRYVIIELVAATDMNAQPRKAVPEDEAARAERDRMQGGPGLKAGWSTGGNDIYPGDVTIKQELDVLTINGDTIYPDGELYKSSVHRCEVVDDFKQCEFISPYTGQCLPYNLYIPSDYNPDEQYPLLLFIHDAGVAGSSVEQTLVQGRGAVTWASTEFQNRHKCIVVAPQYPVVTVDDNWNYSHHLDATIALIRELQKTYSIDDKRIYTTGQSMGCMSSIVMMMKEPNLFAGALLVAGKWNPELMRPLSQQNIWIISCEGDAHSNKLQSEAVSLWREDGAYVAEETWDMELPLHVLSQKARCMQEGNTHLLFTHLRGGNHRMTWFIAYDIVGVQEWLFAQQRND